MLLIFCAPTTATHADYGGSAVIVYLVVYLLARLYHHVGFGSNSRFVRSWPPSESTTLGYEFSGRR